MTMGDASGNRPSTTPTPIHNFFGQKNTKRVRTDDEFSGNELTPTQSTNTLSSRETLPAIRINNEAFQDNTSTVESITTPSRLDKDKERLALRLDKLNDKRGRFESHVAFLKKCVDNNLTPNGLRVYVEPSIGNRDEEFLNNWHELLNGFSKTLTKNVIAYSEATIKRTADEIKEVTDELKALVTTRVYTDIETTLSNNDKSRSNELTQRKNRNFIA